MGTSQDGNLLFFYAKTAGFAPADCAYKWCASAGACAKKQTGAARHVWKKSRQCAIMASRWTNGMSC